MPENKKKYRLLFVIISLTLLLGFLVFWVFKPYQAFTVPTGSMENTIMTDDNIMCDRFSYKIATPRTLFGFEVPSITFIELAQPKKNDIIIFVFPGNRDQLVPNQLEYYMKRCIAVAGDTLYISDSKVFVNAKEFMPPPGVKFEYKSGYYQEEYDKAMTFPPGKDYTRDNYGPIRIPKKGDVIQLTSQNYIEWQTFIRREGHSITFEYGNIILDGKISTTYTVERDYVFGMGDNRNYSLDSRYWGFIPMEYVDCKADYIYLSRDILINEVK